MVQHQIVYAGELVVIQHRGDVKVLDFPQPDALFEAVDFFSNANLFAGCPGFALAGSDKKTYIALLDVERTWGVRIELDRGEVQQIAFNAFLRYHRLKHSIGNHAKTAKTEHEPVFCLDCLLSDGSIWTLAFDNEEYGKLIRNVALGAKFSEKFQLIEELTGVKSIQTNNIFAEGCPIQNPLIVRTKEYDDELVVLEYAPTTNEPDYFGAYSEDESSEREEKVEFGLSTASQSISREATVCIATNAPEQVGFFLYMGCLLPFYIHQMNILPESLAARRDIEACTVVYIPERDVYQFYVVTIEYQLIVYYGDKVGYAAGANEYLVGGDQAKHIRWTEVGLVDEVYCFPTLSDPVVYCRIAEDLYIELFDRGKISYCIPEIPRMFRPIPTKFTPVKGSIDARKYSVAISHKNVFVLQSDNTILRLKFVLEHPIIENLHLHNVASIAAGWNHVVALLDDGTVQAELLDSPVLHEGERTIFYLEDGYPTRKRGSGGAEHHRQHFVPENLTDVVGVFCGDWVTYALRRDGTVVAWGRNDFSQMESAYHIENITQICGGHMHALFLDADGNVHHVGACRIKYDHIFPEVTENIKRIHTSGNSAVVLMNDGTVLDAFSEEHKIIASDSSIVDIAVTQGLYAILYATGRLVIHDRRNFKQNSENERAIDSIVLEGISCITANNDTLICTGLDGHLYGMHSSDQFGRNSKILIFPENVRALVDSDFVVAPGEYIPNTHYRLNNERLRQGLAKQHDRYERPLDIQCKPITDSYFIGSDGFVYAWNYTNTAEIYSTEYSNAVALATNRHHLMVLHADGTISTRITNADLPHFEQHEVPAEANNVVGIACTDEVSFALLANATVVSWGNIDSDEKIALNPHSNVVSIQAGSDHVLLQREYEGILLWGSSENNLVVPYRHERYSPERLHSVEKGGVVLTAGEVYDLFDESCTCILQNHEIVDVVETCDMYGLLYADGSMQIIDWQFVIPSSTDEEPFPKLDTKVHLHGVNSIFATANAIYAIGFDGRVWGIRTSATSDNRVVSLNFPNDTRVLIRPGLSQLPDKYDAELCNQINIAAIAAGEQLLRCRQNK